MKQRMWGFFSQQRVWGREQYIKRWCFVQEICVPHRERWDSNLMTVRKMWWKSFRKTQKGKRWHNFLFFKSRDSIVFGGLSLVGYFRGGGGEGGCFFHKRFTHKHINKRSKVTIRQYRHWAMKRVIYNNLNYKRKRFKSPPKKKEMFKKKVKSFDKIRLMKIKRRISVPSRRMGDR